MKNCVFRSWISVIAARVIAAQVISAQWIICALLTSGLPGTLVQAADLSYNRDVRPILTEKCFSCHGMDSAARQAGLRLDQRDAAIEMGAIEPGDVEASELVARILTEDPSLVMPPPEIKKSLTKEEIDVLTRWIAEGAPYEAHWSFIPPEPPALPTVENSDWIKTPVDTFILAKLEQMGVEPAEEADAHTLIRRLHLDITGLPPEPELVQQFVNEYQSEGDRAWERWVEQLMKSPAWGEHQARYWLDASRYADTHGLHFDNYREMWPYRDWVIRAFNSNQPFDQFTIEQVAGDLLPDPSLDQLVATGFQRCNITTNEGGTIAEENLALYAADRVQTLGWVYLGLTTNCAQCHDHKFDPFTMADYYSLAAFFRNTTQGAFDGNVSDGKGPVIRVPSMDDLPRWQALPEEIASAKHDRQARRESSDQDFAEWLAAVSKEHSQSHARDEGLVVHALLAEGAGSQPRNFADSQLLKPTGEVAWSAEGKFGPAPVLKKGATFEVGDVANFEQDQAFSFGAWVKAGPINGTGSILARMDQSAQHRGWDLWHENGAIGVHVIHSWPDNALKVVTRKPVLETGVWHHVFAAYDGSGQPSGVRVYIDGKRLPLDTANDTLQPGSTVKAATPLRIGQRSSDQAFEGASIQDVRVYATELDKSEIRALAKEIPLAALLSLSNESSKDEGQKPEQKTEQNTALLTYYLNNVDKEFMRLDGIVSNLQAEQAEIEKRSPLTHIQKEKADSSAVANILMRGEYDQVGDQVAAATPGFLPPMPEGLPGNRLGLAHWIVDRDNPLTARVTVNRFWQQLFGKGIVVTPEDFGVSGAMPSHPELLDWLAVEFRESGWDVKGLFRTMLMSAAYRQSALSTPEKLELDPGNQWLTRGPRFRMDGEMLRDYALATSGLLSDDMFGPPVKPYQPEGIWDVVGLPGGDTRNYQQSQGKDLYRRSLYTFWKRMAPPPNLEVFNAPSREVCSVQRERTNTPLQALVTLNDPQFVEAARVLASRVLAATPEKESVTNDNQILDRLAWQALCRPLSIGEQAILLTGKEQLANHFQSNAEEARQLVSVGEFPVDDRLDVSELAVWTLICNQLLNLDEALNK
jgi:hypothetical protein